MGIQISPSMLSSDFAHLADEAQRIKNAGTVIAATVKALPRQRAWALTGTPLENRPDDAVSILDFVAPGLHDPATMVAGLRRALSVVQLRRRRAAVLPDLPPKTVFELAPDLLPAQRVAYDTAHREGLVWLRSLRSELRVTHVLELILRLKQICNACPRTGASAKLLDLHRRLHEVAAASEKALVFSQFTGFLAHLRTALDEAGITYAYLDGTTRDRQAAIAGFKDGEAPVFLISLKAGGFGLNLTEADYCFLLDLEGHIADEVVADCLRALHSKHGDVKFLGSYPAAGDHGPAARRDHGLPHLHDL